VLGGWHQLAIFMGDDVVHRQNEVIVLGDVHRPRHPVGQAQQSDDMHRLGLFDRGVEASERADVDHVASLGCPGAAEKPGPSSFSTRSAKRLAAVEAGQGVR